MANFVRSLPGPVQPGFVITIDGFIPSRANRLSFNLSATPIVMGGDIAIHVNPRYDEDVVVRNTFEKGAWQVEERYGPPPPLLRNAHFQCTITAFHDKYQVAFNGQYYCDFRHRIPMCVVNSFIATGDVQVSNVDFGESGGCGKVHA